VNFILFSFLDHTQTRHTRWDSSGRVISPTQRPLPDNKQQSQQTNNHAPCGILTRNSSKRAATGIVGGSIYTHLCVPRL